jgi:membrane glycosyltransferase
MDVPWRDAAQRFATPCLLTLAIAVALAGAHPPALLWLMPVGLPLLTAIPFIVWTSRSDLGEKVRDAGLLLVPEESRSPSVLSHAWRYTRLPGWLMAQDVEGVELAA